MPETFAPLVGPAYTPSFQKAVNEPRFVTRKNSFEGGTDTTLISVGNSGGASGDAFNNLNSFATFTAGQSFHGSLSANWNYTGTSANAQLIWDTLGGVGVNGIVEQVYGRFYLRYAAAPSGGTAQHVFLDNKAFGFVGSLNVTTAGKLQWQNAGGVIAASLSTTVLSANTWYRVEWSMLPSTTGGLCAWQLYQGDSLTPLETNTQVGQNMGTDVQDCRHGCTNVFATFNYQFWMDDIGFTTQGWMGPVAGAIVNPLRLTAAVTAVAFPGWQTLAARQTTITAVGAIARSTTKQFPPATVTATPVIQRQAGKQPKTSVTALAAIQRQAAAVRNASTSTLAAIQRQAGKQPNASITAQASTQRQMPRTLAAAVTTLAVLPRQAGKQTRASITGLASIIADFVGGASVIVTGMFTSSPRGQVGDTASERNYHDTPTGVLDSHAAHGGYAGHAHDNTRFDGLQTSPTLQTSLTRQTKGG